MATLENLALDDDSSIAADTKVDQDMNLEVGNVNGTLSKPLDLPLLLSPSEVQSAQQRPKSESDTKPGPRESSLVDEIMNAMKAKGVDLDSTTESPDASENIASPATAKNPKYTRSLSETLSKPSTVAKPKVTSPTAPPKPKAKPVKAASPVASPAVSPVATSPPEADESFKSRKPSGSVTPLATDEPQLHHLPDVDAAPALKHLNKERPKRAKKQAARRPVPAAAISADQAENGIDVVVDDFFKPATVSQTPVVITTPATKPRAGSKADKGDDSPKLNKKSTKSSNKEKQENDKKKGSRTSSGAKGMIATGISNFFKKKPKPEKPVDQTDTKSAESTPSAPQRPERASQSHQTPTPKSRAGSAVIPDQPELSELKTPGTENAQLSAAAVKTGSLERTADPMSASTISTISEDGGGEHGAPIPAPKRKPMGFGMPGMTGGLLAEMQAKRNTMQQPQQPKPASRAPPAKTEEATSPPARPQPPLLKPTTPTSEHKKEEPTPPVRPSPPKPVAAPREAMKPLPAPAPAPAAAPTSTATPAPATKSKPPPPILRPKPPKVSPKPGGRPVTMTELPGRSPGASKAAPPKPPPPDPSKRQTYVAPKLFSPTKPAPPAFPKMTPESSPVVEKKPPIVESVTVSEDAASNPPDEPPSISDNPDIPKPVIQEPSTASLTPAERGPPAEVNTCVPEEQEQDGEKLKSAASQGDISAAEKQTSGTEVTNRNMIDSTNSRDSIAEEISAVNLRTSSRSSSVRLSNGSTSSDKRLSTPLTLSARVEDGPVLQPPPPKKRQSAEQSSHTDNAGTDSGEESLV